ncbi:MAG: SRPBCC domain-containing protein [Solirubrobacteraceae bacterium]
MSATDSTTLRLERTYDAPPEDVFDAWTNPEVLRRWWVANPAWRTPVADVDLRVGGAYRLSMEDPDAGKFHTVRGEYREVRRPERLVYSWCWEEDDGRTGHVSTVQVDFLDEGERTTVVLEHTDLPSPESRDGHSEGWQTCLEMLEARVFTPAQHAS